MTTFTLRCSRCSRERQFTGTLEQARAQLCGPCSVHSHYQARMTVIGHEQAPETPIDLSRAPAMERPRLLPGVDEKARRLVLSALEGE
jgi:hypothetical protein